MRRKRGLSVTDSAWVKAKLVDAELKEAPEVFRLLEWVREVDERDVELLETIVAVHSAQKDSRHKRNVQLLIVLAVCCPLVGTALAIAVYGIPFWKAASVMGTLGTLVGALIRRNFH